MFTGGKPLVGHKVIFIFSPMFPPERVILEDETTCELSFTALTVPKKHERRSMWADFAGEEAVERHTVHSLFRMRVGGGLFDAE